MSYLYFQTCRMLRPWAIWLCSCSVSSPPAKVFRNHAKDVNDHLRSSSEDPILWFSCHSQIVRYLVLFVFPILQAYTSFPDTRATPHLHTLLCGLFKYSKNTLSAKTGFVFPLMFYGLEPIVTQRN